MKYLYNGDSILSTVSWTQRMGDITVEQFCEQEGYTQVEVEVDFESKYVIKKEDFIGNTFSKTLYDERVANIELDILRKAREKECFPIINRSQLWYSTLTQEQLTELELWYQDWLNVTTTLVKPIKPIWLV